MSLLLEALKKAELAKEAAKEQLQAASTPPFTRDKLPDISQPMEIHSDDLNPTETAPEPAPAPKSANKPVLELALEEPTRAAPEPPPRAAAMEIDFTPPTETEERKQAQQLFEAKELDVNPRKPFYITVGALGLFALGTVVYFWYQLQPRSAFTVPPPSAKTAPPTPLPAPPAPVLAAPTAVTPSVPAPAAVPVAAAPAPAVPQAKAQPTRRTAPASAARAGETRKGKDIKITPARVETDPVLMSAYQAFNAGQLARARDDYQQVLRDNPDNRDALLGMAAVELQGKYYGAAASIYSHLLELDPQDAYAHAGLIGLKGQIDPLAAESRLKNMIAAQPEAGFLQFTLGNQYAAQGLWPEAQQAYFRAYSGDPEHPDFAYNLAVSLDKLHQTKPALEYYRRALTLAEGHPVSFDIAQVNKRVSQLAH